MTSAMTNRVGAQRLPAVKLMPNTLMRQRDLRPTRRISFQLGASATSGSRLARMFPVCS
jgi:hypothetical protein